MKRMMGYLAILFYITAVIVLALTGVMWMMQIKPAVVVSGSMEPAIRTGSIVLIDKKDKEIKTGDVIGYKAGQVTVVHRVIDVADGNYVTKGDNNESADISAVSPQRVTGTVLTSVPGLGYAVNWLAGPGVILILSGASCAAFAAFCLKKENEVITEDLLNIKSSKVKGETND